eukprot:g44437.t1
MAGSGNVSRRPQKNSNVPHSSKKTETRGTQKEDQAGQEEKAFKIIFWSRVRTMEQDEVCSHFFFQKVHKESSVLSSLKEEDRYRQLKLPVVPVLDHGCHGKRLDQPLSLDELTKALESLEKNKNPRSDSLPAELYSTLLDLIGQDMLEACRFMSICDQFKLTSGAKINQGKSKAMFFGNWANRSFIPFTIRTCYLKVWPISRTCAVAITRAIFCFMWRSEMDCIHRDTMYRTLDGRGKNIPNTALITDIVKDETGLIKFAKKNTFDQKSIRKWSACSILENRRQKEGLDPVKLFPEQTVKVI